VGRDFIRTAARRPKCTPKPPQPGGDIQLKAAWGVFCKTVGAKASDLGRRKLGLVAWARQQR
jgi:hypothetical protein